jgi:hypothetical protein
LARDSGTTVIDLTSDWNSPTALNLVDSSLPRGTRRTGGAQVSWQSWSSTSSITKSRATKTHQPSDPVVRVAIPLHVNTPAGCLAVNAHIVYYMFPDNSGFNFAGVVDSWDTLTDNWSTCQSQVNDKLRQIVPTTIPSVQALVNARMSQLPNQHFPFFEMLPVTSVGKGDVEVVLFDAAPVITR